MKDCNIKIIGEKTYNALVRMIEPITIRGNIRMTNYGQLIYNQKSRAFLYLARRT